MWPMFYYHLFHKYLIEEFYSNVFLTTKMKLIEPYFSIKKVFKMIKEGSKLWKEKEILEWTNILKWYETVCVCVCECSQTQQGIKAERRREDYVIIIGMEQIKHHHHKRGSENRPHPPPFLRSRPLLPIWPTLLVCQLSSYHWDWHGIKMGNWKLIANVILYHLPLERKNTVDNSGYKYKSKTFKLDFF